MQSAAESRDPFLTLRRVEREHRLIELLAAAPDPTPVAALAARLRASPRTLERDLERLRQSGLPIEARRGRGGGVRLAVAAGDRTVVLSVVEIAALLASLVALGPTATDPAASATRALVAALETESAQPPTRGPRRAGSVPS